MPPLSLLVCVASACSSPLLAWGVSLLLVFSIIIVASDLLLRGRLLDHPVEDKVILVAHTVEQVLEELSEVTNVWLLLKLKTPTVVQIYSKLVWKTLCQCLD